MLARTIQSRVYSLPLLNSSSILQLPSSPLNISPIPQRSTFYHSSTALLAHKKPTKKPPPLTKNQLAKMNQPKPSTDSKATTTETAASSPTEKNEVSKSKHNSIQFFEEDTPINFKYRPNPTVPPTRAPFKAFLVQLRHLYHRNLIIFAACS